MAAGSEKNTGKEEYPKRNIKERLDFNNRINIDEFDARQRLQEIKVREDEINRKEIQLQRSSMIEREEWTSNHISRERTQYGERSPGLSPYYRSTRGVISPILHKLGDGHHHLLPDVKDMEQDLTSTTI